MPKRTVNDILAEEDDLGLLNVKPAAGGAVTEADRIKQAFEEINVFVERYGFLPGEGPAGRKPSVTERALQVRLKTYRDKPALASVLSDADRHGLLIASKVEEALPVQPVSLDDILEDSDELLATPAEDIFRLRHARSAPARSDKKSERKPCTEFAKFEPIFNACASDLSTGRRKSLPFAREQEINAGDFFVLNGIMAYVAEVRDPHIRNGRKNARLRLIFDNGTEGENLLRSLATELYKDPNGRRISDPESGPLFGSEPTTVKVAASTERVIGSIYVVKSLSPLPEIRKLDGSLFKIGFTTGSVEARLRGVQDDPTFLLAAVHPVRSWDAINLNANKVENLLHRFFGDTRLDIVIMDRFGKPFRPREWFLVPLPVIEQAVEMLLDGSIVRYRYDATIARIVRRIRAALDHPYEGLGRCCEDTWANCG